MEEALRDADSFWAKWAHGIWLKHGDRCSKLFHKILNSLGPTSKIQSLRIEGATCNDLQTMEDHFKESFKALYAEPESQRPFFDDLPLKSITQDQVRKLEDVFSEEQV